MCVTDKLTSEHAFICILFKAVPQGKLCLARNCMLVANYVSVCAESSLNEVKMLLDYYTRLGHEFKSDLAPWDAFLVGWNGLSLLQSVSHATPADFVIQSHASGTWGWGSSGSGLRTEPLCLLWQKNWYPLYSTL